VALLVALLGIVVVEVIVIVVAIHEVVVVR
jgi:hypothetical protein